MIVLSMKKARNWFLETGFQISTPIFFRKQSLEIEARNQFLRNYDAFKQALRKKHGFISSLFITPIKHETTLIPAL
jgi:hypothetical protein